MKFPERIQALMDEHGIHNAHLFAKMCDLPYTTVRSMLQTTTAESTRLSTLVKVANCFGITVDELIHGKEQGKLKEAPAPQDVEQEPTSHELDEWFSALPYNVKRNTMAMLSSAYEHYGQMAVMAAQDEILHKQLLREMQKQAVGNSEMEDVRIG